MTTHCHAGETVDKIFTEQPDPLDLCELNGETIFLRWIAQYDSEPCDYPIINVITMNYTLHPDDNIFLPIEIKEEFNATVKDDCISGKTRINVTLSIHLSEYVLEHVPYVACIITRSTVGVKPDRSKNLYLQANRNCFSTTTGKQSTDVTTANKTIADPLELSQTTVINYASCVHCNGSLNFINILYYVLFVFVTILLAVLEL